MIRPLWIVERDAIIHAIKECRGNKTEAAKKLKIGRATLFRKLKYYAENHAPFPYEEPLTEEQPPFYLHTRHGILFIHDRQTRKSFASYWNRQFRKDRNG